MRTVGGAALGVEPGAALGVEPGAALGVEPGAAPGVVPKTLNELVDGFGRPPRPRETVTPKIVTSETQPLENPTPETPTP